jgi:dihydrofolate reductase
MINIIVATSINGVIGCNNKLIWDLPTDLKRFKEITTGHSVIMGRKTYESIGKPLKNRRNIIISRNKNYKVDGCEVVFSLKDAIKLTNNNCFIIGGGEIYNQSIEIADKIYLTIIDKEFYGDVKFPKLNDDWIKIKSEDFLENKIKCSFLEYERKKR